jgi:hypothetical protein
VSSLRHAKPLEFRIGDIPYVGVLRAVREAEQANCLALRALLQRQFAAIEIGLADLAFFFLASGSSAAASTAAGVISPRNIRMTGAGHAVMSICEIACGRLLGTLLRFPTISTHSAKYAFFG